MVIAVCVARSGSLSPSRLCMHELAALSDGEGDRCLCVSQCLSRLVNAHCSLSERGGARRLCVSQWLAVSLRLVWGCLLDELGWAAERT